MNLYKGPGAAATTATSTTLTASGTANATTAVNTTTAATTAVTTTSTTAAATTTASGPDGLVPISQVAGWGQIAQNCWTEGPGGVRALQGFAAAGSTMSVTRCVNACADRGFKYAGVEYGRECYCGNELHPQSKSADAASWYVLTRETVCDKEGAESSVTWLAWAMRRKPAAEAID